MDTAAGTAEVGALASVLFHVGAFDPDLRSIGQSEEAIDVQGLVVLTDLIRLGHVGIEVVLAVERARLDGAVQRQADAHRQLDRLAVQHGQRAGQAQRHRIDVGVGLVAESVRAGGEQLGHRRQLDVDFETHYQFPVTGKPVERAHCAALTVAALSSAAAARNICGSHNVPASTCTPTGRPSAPVPKGTLIPGWPERLAGIVYTSHKYIANGLSPLSPNGKATLGEAGVNSTSASW